MKCNHRILDGSATMACQEDSTVRTVQFDRLIEGQPTLRIDYWCDQHAEFDVVDPESILVMLSEREVDDLGIAPYLADPLPTFALTREVEGIRAHARRERQARERLAERLGIPV